MAASLGDIQQQRDRRQSKPRCCPDDGGNQNSGQDPSDFYAGPGSFKTRKSKSRRLAMATRHPIQERNHAPVNTTLLNAIITAGYKNTPSNYHFVTLR